MDFLDRLRVLMENNKDNNSSLAKKSGIPYTTIDGLFKRGWEKAQISTIQRICAHYNVTLDYMVYGAKGLSDEASMIAGKYDNLSPAGKELIRSTMEFASKHLSARAPLPDEVKARMIGTFRGVPLIEGKLDGTVEMKHAAFREQKPLAEELEQVPESEPI